jgi:putative PIN family toxin of toxin-antitoxin system
MIPNRVVLDTNVCLDLFVFHDPRCSALLTALRDGHLEAVTRSDCRKEWLAVLDYPHLPLDDESRAAATQEFDALINCIDITESRPRMNVQLPMCSDRDDQKFLEIARDSAAHILITKDKALLKLARKITKAGLFGIITPEAWRPKPQHETTMQFLPFEQS